MRKVFLKQIWISTSRIRYWEFVNLVLPRLSERFSFFLVNLYAKLKRISFLFRFITIVRHDNFMKVDDYSLTAVFVPETHGKDTRVRPVIPTVLLRASFSGPVNGQSDFPRPLVRIRDTSRTVGFASRGIATRVVDSAGGDSAVYVGAHVHDDAHLRHVAQRPISISFMLNIYRRHFRPRYRMVGLRW